MFLFFFFFSSRRRHTRYWRDWSSDVCSSDLELDRNSDRGVDEEALTVVRQQAQRCREIVRDLLAMARRREEAREVIDLGPLAERAVLALRPRLIDAGVQVEVSVPREAACVLADRAGLEQVVTNLVSNAADATGAGGRVTVEVRRE